MRSLNGALVFLSMPLPSSADATPDHRGSAPTKGEVLSGWEPLFDPHYARSEQQELRRKQIEYIVVAFVVTYLAIYEWLRWLVQAPMQPAALSLFAAGIVTYCLARIAILRWKRRALFAAQHLWEALAPAFNQLGSHGFYVFEGLTDRSGALLGPILVGPTGVYCLTIKTTPPTGRLLEKVDHLDTTTLRTGGRPAFGNPLELARNTAQRLETFLCQSGVPGISATPVLVFPGWRMGQQPPEEQRDVLVANETTLAREVLERPSVLEPKDILAVSDALK